MPVGESQHEQRLVKVARTDAAHFEEEDLGGVMFVPLIGEHGWAEDARARGRRRPAASESLPPSLFPS